MTYQDGPQYRCKRIGCSRRRTGPNIDRDCCSASCSHAYRLHNEAQAIAATLGHSDPVDDYLLATLEIGKALDKAHKARATLRRLSLDAGWSTEQWDDLTRQRAHPAGRASTG